MCSKPVMRSWCMQCLFLPGLGSIRQSNCGPRGHIRLSGKHWEVFWRHLLCCSLGPTHEAALKCQKALAWVKLFDVVPSPRWRRLKYCMVMQLHVLFFNFCSCLLWQMSDLGFECSGMRKWFNIRSHVDVGQCTCVRATVQYREQKDVSNVSLSMSLCRMRYLYFAKRQHCTENIATLRYFISAFLFHFIHLLHYITEHNIVLFNPLHVFDSYTFKLLCRYFVCAFFIGQTCVK